MNEYVRLFPIIFMFHDMEEIIGFKYFLRQNTAELQQRFPFILRRYKDFLDRRLCPCCLRRTHFVYCNFNTRIFYRPQFSLVSLAGSFSWLRSPFFHSPDSGKHLPPLYSCLHHKFNLPSGKHPDYLQVSFVH